MRKFESSSLDVTVEVVTTTFVASGRPTGVHDLARFVENLNNQALFRQFEIEDPVVRPLYRAGHQVALGAPLLVRRDDVIFANFEGPSFSRGEEGPVRVNTPALLMAPPFQIAGSVALPAGADPTQAMRGMMQSFFIVRDAVVYDADGNTLGEGRQIIVNGNVVQMASPTARHIDAVAVRAPFTPRAEAEPADDGVLADAEPDARAA